MATIKTKDYDPILIANMALKHLKPKDNEAKSDLFNKAKELATEVVDQVDGEHLEGGGKVGELTSSERRETWKRVYQTLKADNYRVNPLWKKPPTLIVEKGKFVEIKEGSDRPLRVVVKNGGFLTLSPGISEPRTSLFVEEGGTAIVGANVLLGSAAVEGGGSIEIEKNAHIRNLHSEVEATLMPEAALACYSLVSPEQVDPSWTDCEVRATDARSKDISQKD
ncbi:MAG: hypothetical protein HYU97_09550 [Deltaproteobacteria bacterium]|nr:hypothetical protein [Deltaproteobacteria bacterium]